MTKKRKYKKRIKKRVSFFQKYKKRLSIFIVILLLLPVAYITYEYTQTVSNQKTKQKKVYLDKSIIKKMNKMLQEQKRKVDILKKEIKRISKVKKRDKNNSKKITKIKLSSEAIDYKKSLSIKTKQKKVKREKNITVVSKKPLLSIIIDDVSFQNEVNNIKKLPFKVTPSIFPPTKVHPNTPKLAKEFSFYMVHLPLQAYDYSHPEPNTLLITSSSASIEKRIENVKKWFPRDKFLNNHTGSKFTSNYNAMVKLFKALKKNHIIFVDSRTSAATVAFKVAQKFHEKLLSRNVFLDNIAKVSYIKNQLKKAVAIAKKNGYAIAIGHPHLATMKALRESLDILKGVKLVYVKDIYENSSYSTK